MIAVAAYYRAEHRGFDGGDPSNDWLEAEAEINRLLAQGDGSDKQAAAKRAFQEKLEAQLREWDERLDDLQAKAQALKATARKESAKQIKALGEMRALAATRLQELRRHSEDAWEDMKEGIEKSWKEMRDAIEQAAKRFK